jgi:SAM-dependent methyltransferase
MLNKILSPFGLQIVKVRSIPKQFITEYNRNYKVLLAERNFQDIDILRELRYESGHHPKDHRDVQCEFAAEHINKILPQKILDVGSYRLFILGLLSAYSVTTLDIRKRDSMLNNETILTCDAKYLNLPDNSFDLVLSLHTLEHIGLGRYGEVFDLDADKMAFNEMIRVLKPSGHIIFTTIINNSNTLTIAYNAHRIYTYEILKTFCKGLTSIEETFWNYKTRNWCSLEEVTHVRGEYALYCGCWRKC